MAMSSHWYRRLAWTRSNTSGSDLSQRHRPLRCDELEGRLDCRVTCVNFPRLRPSTRQLLVAFGWSSRGPTLTALPAPPTRVASSQVSSCCARALRLFVEPCSRAIRWRRHRAPGEWMGSRPGGFQLHIAQFAKALAKCSENARTFAAWRRSGGQTRCSGKGLGSQPGNKTCTSPLSIKSWNSQVGE